MVNPHVKFCNLLGKNRSDFITISVLACERLLDAMNDICCRLPSYVIFYAIIGCFYVIFLFCKMFYVPFFGILYDICHHPCKSNFNPIIAFHKRKLFFTFSCVHAVELFMGYP